MVICLLVGLLGYIVKALLTRYKKGWLKRLDNEMDWCSRSYAQELSKEEDWRGLFLQVFIILRQRWLTSHLHSINASNTMAIYRRYAPVS